MDDIKNIVKNIQQIKDTDTSYVTSKTTKAVDSLLKDILLTKLNKLDTETIEQLFASGFLFPKNVLPFSYDEHDVNQSPRVPLLSGRFGRFYRYLTYEYMCKLTPELESAIQTYVEYATQTTISGEHIYFTVNPYLRQQSSSVDDTIQNLYTLFYRWGMDTAKLRQMFEYAFKYGDAFLKLNYYKSIHSYKDKELISLSGIESVDVIAPYNIMVYTNRRGDVLGYAIKPRPMVIPYTSAPLDYSFSSVWQQAGYLGKDAISNPLETEYITLSKVIDNADDVEEDLITRFEMVHITFRKGIYAPYGTSILESLRRDWKIYMLIKDMWGMAQLSKGVSKRVYKIAFPQKKNINDMQSDFNTIMNRYKNKPVTQNGEYNTRAVVETFLSDFFIPVTADYTLDITGEIAAIDYSGIKEMVEYYEKKLYTALKIPRAILANEEQVNGKNTLIEEVEAFLRTITAALDEIASSFFNVFLYHYTAINRQNDLIGIVMHFAQPFNSSFESSRVETLKTKIEGFSALIEMVQKLVDEKTQKVTMDVEYILRELGLNPNMIKIEDIAPEQPETTEGETKLQRTLNAFEQRLNKIFAKLEGEKEQQQGTQGEVTEEQGSLGTEESMGGEEGGPLGFGEEEGFGGGFGEIGGGLGGFGEETGFGEEGLGLGEETGAGGIEQELESFNIEEKVSSLEEDIDKLLLEQQKESFSKKENSDILVENELIYNFVQAQKLKEEMLNKEHCNILMEIDKEL